MLTHKMRRKLWPMYRIRSRWLPKYDRPYINQKNKKECSGDFVMTAGSCQAPKECAILYAECNYSGASYNICDKSANFQKDSVPPAIKSIKVPPKKQVTVYENKDFEGRKIVYTESQSCITSYNVFQRKSKWILVGTCKSYIALANLGWKC